MFIVTNTKNQVRELKNKDELLWYVENTSARIADNQEEDEVTLKHVSDLGEILDSMQLSLPLQSHVEIVLADFGNKKEPKPSRLDVLRSKKASAKTNVSEDANVQPTAKPAQNEPKMAVSAPKKLSILGFLALLVALGGLGLSGMLYMQQQVLVNELKTTQGQLQEIVSLQEKEHSVDLFARYFLSNYYTGDESKIVAYVSKDLSDGPINLPTGQLQSAVIESISRKKEAYLLTYVVAVKTDETSQSHRLTFQVKEDKASDYGFLVTKLPKKTVYP